MAAKARLIFYIGGSDECRTRLLLAQVPPSPRSLVLSHKAKLGSIRQTYLVHAPVVRHSAAHIRSLFSPKDVRFAGDDQDASKLLRLTTFDTIAITHIDGATTRYRGFFDWTYRVGNFAQEQNASVAVAIPPEILEDSEESEAVLQHMGLTAPDLVAFYIRSQTSCVRYLRLEASGLQRFMDQYRPALDASHERRHRSI